jgi:hypothetical protein
MQPEMGQLRTAFKKLRKLYVRGIFVEFDILWITAFLVAAPSIEMLHVEVMQLSLVFRPKLCYLCLLLHMQRFKFCLNAV